MALSTRLWAPWRSRYLKHPARRGCIFCRAARSRQRRRHHVVLRQPQVFALLNRYPYNNGHVMIAPRRHVSDLLELTTAEWAAILSVTQQLMRRLQRTLHPHGFNIGLNLGRVAGAGIPGHLHLHLVPRWQGDTNFMPVIGATKVVSQSLDELYRFLTSSAR
ncbi:MAG: HIT domain-containing protein [Candidatus Omnitrophica bacterium]|nr:HIT domain-containing protein [Candidatus Omnitrophota bacterium]